MKQINIVIAAFIAMMTAVSCGKEQNVPEEPINPAKEGKTVTIHASIPEELTKVALGYTGTALALTWQEGDQIIVSDHSNPGNKQTFTLASGEGTKNAKFTGTAVSASSFDIQLISNMPSAAGMLSQTQATDGSTAHLGYSATLSGVSSYEDVAFTQAWATSKGGTFTQSGALHVSVTLPDGVAAKVNKVTMKADQDIFGAAGGTMVVNITNPGDTGSDNTFDVFATIPTTGVLLPKDLGILFKFGTTDANHDVYTRYYQTPSAMTLAPGQLNLISLTGTNSDKYAGKNDDGTEAHPYLIADKYQVAAINSLAVKGATTYFKMIDDVDMTGVTHTPINDDGSTSPTYNRAVNFDGNGKTISKLGVNLFYVFKGSIQNLTLSGCSVGNKRGIFAEYCQGEGNTITNVDIMGSSMSSTSANSGALIGRVNSGSGTTVTIKDCDITSTTVSGAAATGGFIGIIQAQVKIDNCTTAATVSGSDNNIGGFIGNFAAAATITGCSASGTVTNTGSGKQSCGGFVGNMNSAGDKEISKCYATGDISPSGEGAGGFVGKIEGAQTSNYSIHDCYATGDIVKNVNYAGSFVGRIIKSAGTVTFTNSYATGTNWAGYGFGHGGFVGRIDAAITTIQKCAGWSSQVKGQTDLNKWSAGAVVGVAFPTCTLTDNYRKPGMTLYAYWGTTSQTQTLTDDFQHENVSSTNPLWTYDGEGHFVQTTKTTLNADDGSGIFAYQGKCDKTKTLSELASTTLGWSSDVWDFSTALPTLK